MDFLQFKIISVYFECARLFFKKPIKVRLRYKNGIFFLSSRKFRIFVYEKEFQKAFDGFQGFLISLWKNIGKAEKKL